MKIQDFIINMKKQTIYFNKKLRKMNKQSWEDLLWTVKEKINSYLNKIWKNDFDNNLVFHVILRIIEFN